MHGVTLAAEVDRVARAKIARELWRDLGAQVAAGELERVRRLLAVWSGDERARCRPHQRRKGLFMPGLGGNGWLEPAAFGFSAQLLRAYPAIRRELSGLLAQGSGFAQYRPGFDESFDAGWQALHLCRSNRARRRELASCPEAARVLRRVRSEMGWVEQYSFLRLLPGTRLPAHVDRCNYLVSVQLGLIVPAAAGLRVAGRTRYHREGGCLAFDNSFEHSAWNHGDAQRVILTVQTFHPGVTPIERAALRLIHPLLNPLEPPDPVRDAA